MNSEEKAHLLLDTVEDRKAVEPVLLDLRDKSLLADFFLICSGTSNVHIRAITARVLERTEDERLPKPRVEGQENAEWVLIDFGDVVLHVMGEEPRARYKLEQFWSTPQPKGALPPTPGSALAGKEALDDVENLNFDDDEVDLDDEDLVDEEDEVDEAFFTEADTEVEPIDEDEVDTDDTPSHPSERPGATH